MKLTSRAKSAVATIVFVHSENLVGPILVTRDDYDENVETTQLGRLRRTVGPRVYGPSCWDGRQTWFGYRLCLQSRDVRRNASGTICANSSSAREVGGWLWVRRTRWKYNKSVETKRRPFVGTPFPGSCGTADRRQGRAREKWHTPRV